MLSSTVAQRLNCGDSGAGQCRSAWEQRAGKPAVEMEQRGLQDNAHDDGGPLGSVYGGDLTCCDRICYGRLDRRDRGAATIIAPVIDRRQKLVLGEQHKAE